MAEELKKKERLSFESYTPVQLSRSPSTGRGAAGEPPVMCCLTMSSNTLQYHPGYIPGISMYNVEQQATQHTVYDSTSQFQARQPAEMPMPSEENNSIGSLTLQHHLSSGSSAVYQQHQQSPPDGSAPLLQQGYPTSMNMRAMTQNFPEIMEEEDFQAQGPGIEAAYTAYQTALKQIFQNTISGRLGEASLSLLEVSEWLLGHVGDLGLTVDEVALHSNRIHLWGEFNTAWLGIFQKQKDMLESGQQLERGQSFMTQDFISKMAKDLIRMCDAVQKYGLVDYQYGVAEEQIIMILTECLDLQESIEGVGANSGMGRAPP